VIGGITGIKQGLREWRSFDHPDFWQLGCHAHALTLTSVPDPRDRPRRSRSSDIGGRACRGVGGAVGNFARMPRSILIGGYNGYRLTLMMLLSSLRSAVASSSIKIELNARRLPPERLRREEGQSQQDRER
jgi:hypothetical protein